MLGLVLMAAIAASPEPQGPPRQWLPAIVGGQVVQLWGWPLNGGKSVGYNAAENPHVFKSSAPKTPEGLLAPGLKLGANGELNAGLDLSHAEPTQGLETTDLDLGRKLGLEDESRCPELPELPRVNPLELYLARYKDYALPGAILAAALIYWLSAQKRERPY